MAQERTIWGAGPKIGLVSATYFAAAMGAQGLYPDLMTIDAPRRVLVAAGGALILLGVAVYLGALVQLRRGLRKGDLVTAGVYRWVRHPLYASQVLFTLPGLALVVGNWLLLALPVVTYAAIRVFVPAEERQLQEEFGPSWESYRRRTPAVFPRPRGRQATPPEQPYDAPPEQQEPTDRSRPPRP